MSDTKRTLHKAGSWLNLSIVGIQFPVAIVIGYLWGRWLDSVFGTRPWLTGLFSLFGIAAGFLNLFRITASAAREEKEDADGTEGGSDEDRRSTPPEASE